MTLSPTVIVGSYMGAIVVAEIVFVVGDVGAGTVCDASLVALLLSHFTLRSPQRLPRQESGVVLDPWVRLLPVLALLPLLRILSVTMPVQRTAEIYWYALVGIPLLLGVLLTLRLLDLNLESVGLGRGIPVLQSAIAWSGVPLGLMAYALARPQPLVGRGSLSMLFVGIIILLLFSGLVEEMLFRGLLQPVAIAAFGQAGLGASALLFAAMYLGTRSAPYVIFILGAGLFFGWCVRRTGSLWGVAIAHGVMNVAALLILPLLWT
jgi:membrane protease YdiL (CAAX protease family)